MENSSNDVTVAIINEDIFKKYKNDAWDVYKNKMKSCADDGDDSKYEPMHELLDRLTIEMFCRCMEHVMFGKEVK